MSFKHFVNFINNVTLIGPGRQHLKQDAHLDQSSVPDKNSR